MSNTGFAGKRDFFAPNPPIAKETAFSKGSARQGCVLHVVLAKSSAVCDRPERATETSRECRARPSPESP
jgi:hypothetical protein